MFGRWDLHFAVANNINKGMLSGSVWAQVDSAANIGREKPVTLFSSPFVWEDLHTSVSPAVVIEGFAANLTVVASSHRRYTYARYE